MRNIHPKRSPDRCPSHPGAFLRDVVLPALDATKSEVAAALGISRQTLHDILSEEQPVTPQMAVRLGTVFKTSAASWLNMQNAYDLWHAARAVGVMKRYRNAMRELANAARLDTAIAEIEAGQVTEFDPIPHDKGSSK